jgi:O-antigen/teichoic acid export membrane protein
VLSPTEFGQVGVITTLAAALSVLVGLGLETAIFRGSLSTAGDAKSASQFVNTVGGFAIVVPLALAATAGAIAPAISPAFGIPADALRLACIGAGAMAAATLVPLALLRAQERLGDYLQLTALQVGVTPVLTILFVAAFDWAVTGWMLAYALSSAILLIRGLVLLGHHWTLEFTSAHLSRSLAFGLPLVPHALSHWGLSVSDRAILGAFVVGPQVGAYYVAYLFSLPVSLLAIALSQATQPLYAEAVTSASGVAGLRQLTTLQTVVTIFTAVAVALIGPALCLVLLPDAYAIAASLIPWLAAGTCLFGLYLVPIAAVALVAGRTQRVWIISVAAAATNVGLNLAFVPSIGTMAAAVNTTIGYGVLLIGIFLYMRRVCDPPLPYDAGRIATGVLVIGAPAAAAAVLTESDSLLGLVIRTIVLVGSAAVLLIGPFRREARVAMRAIRPWNAGNVA